MQQLRNIIKQIPVVGPGIKSVLARYCHWKTNPTRRIDKALARTKNATIVQVGSNDGLTGDPLHELVLRHQTWQALFIEPVPYLFAKLKANYGEQARFRFENVAITSTPGSCSFYYVSEAAKRNLPDLPSWYDQLGGFNRNHILKHFGNSIEPYIARIEVECLPLNAVLMRNQIEHFDLLHIDAEGYDWEVLKQFDLSRHSPSVILFEHKHLALDDKQSAVAFLQSQYTTTNLGADYLCVRR
ncbi:MAG: FkbM family methyltransferase [Verrucomicrobiota bacterium]|jgi:FkbM family methyltransferase